MDTNDDVVIEQGDLEEGGSEEDLEATSSSVASTVAKFKKEIEALKKEKQEYLDGWQRAKADYVNALKRFEAEKVGAIEFGTVMSVQAFIPVMDSLARAEAAGEVPESFRGIAKQLHDAARMLGLEQFGTVGETFDPTLHEALGQDAVTSSEEDNTVTAILEPGWKSKNSVIRPAKVRVAHFAD